MEDIGNLNQYYETQYRKKRGPLHQIHFRRIVLDEGHYIRNPEAQVSVAIRSLIGDFKWILSGTPFVK